MDRKRREKKGVRTYICAFRCCLVYHLAIGIANALHIVRQSGGDLLSPMQQLPNFLSRAAPLSVSALFFPCFPSSSASLCVCVRSSYTATGATTGF